MSKEKAALILTAGVMAVLIIAGILQQQGKAKIPILLSLPVSSLIVLITGSEGDVPQKLIDQLDEKED